MFGFGVGMTIALTMSTMFAAPAALAVERYEVLQYGDKDDYVLRLQKDLYSRGYMETEPTGYFGKETQKAVAYYQERHDLESDGKAGPKTQQAIFGKHYEAIPSSREVKETKESPSLDDDDKKSSSSSGSSSSSSGIKKGDGERKDPSSIMNGDEGATIKKIQKRLKELGYYNYHKITNYYGDITEDAVEAFQEQNGLTSDGVVGKRTNKLLFSSRAKKFSKSSEKKSSTKNSSKSSSSKDKEESKEKEKSTGAKKQSAKGKASASNIISTAKELRGKRYRTGGTGPNTFDCSGFVYYVLRGYGISTPRTSREMSSYSKWSKVSSSGDLQKGDLVFFTSPNSGSGVGHVGIYIGGGDFIHCSSGKAKGVTISNLSSGSYARRFKWGRRVFS